MSMSADYRRPGRYENDRVSNVRKAWDILHSLQCNVEYYLIETNSKAVELPKHALDMMLLYMHRELSDAKALLQDEASKPNVEENA